VTPDQPEDQLYTVVSFTNVDDFIAHLEKCEQRNESSDYGEDDEVDWIVP
jgi:hypothetical protein